MNKDIGKASRKENKLQKLYEYSMDTSYYFNQDGSYVAEEDMVYISGILSNMNLIYKRMKQRPTESDLFGGQCSLTEMRWKSKEDTLTVTPDMVKNII